MLIPVGFIHVIPIEEREAPLESKTMSDWFPKVFELTVMVSIFEVPGVLVVRKPDGDTFVATPKPAVEVSDVIDPTPLDITVKVVPSAFESSKVSVIGLPIIWTAFPDPFEYASTTVQAPEGEAACAGDSVVTTPPNPRRRA